MPTRKLTIAMLAVMLIAGFASTADAFFPFRRFFFRRPVVVVNQFQQTPQVIVNSTPRRVVVSSAPRQVIVNSPGTSVSVTGDQFGPFSNNGIIPGQTVVSFGDGRRGVVAIDDARGVFVNVGGTMVSVSRGAVVRSIRGF